MTGTTPATGPLVGVRILDLTSIVIGPYPMKLLGDMGADVIKIEQPGGDLTRAIGPRRSPGMSAQFLNLNPNKRSIVLDLKREEGHKALMRIAATCDAFVVNIRPQAIEKLRVRYEDIVMVNPAMIYCRIGGFRGDGPDRDKPAIDDVIQSMSGIVDLNRELTGAPAFAPLALADTVCGLLWMNALLAALYRRAVTGEGEEIELPMYDAMASFILATHMYGSVFEPPLGPPLYPRSLSAERGPYETADGALCVAPYSDEQWRRFLSVLGLAHLLDEARFATVFERAAHLDELYRLMAAPLASMTTSDLIEKLEATDVPYSRVQSTAEMVADLSHQEDGIFHVVEHPTEGSLRLVGSPMRFRNNPCNLHELPNLPGQATRAVLMEAGYTELEVDALLADGTVIELAADPVG